MNWRGDPFTPGSFRGGGGDWPRNGARLKGYVYELKGARYLAVHEQIPAGKTDWQPVETGKWMPFDGGRHNGGKWLHTPEEWAAWKGGGVDVDETCRRY